MLRESVLMDMGGAEYHTEQLGERALKNMMGGKLATDKDKKGPKVLVQPEWMKGDRSAMSEEQLRQRQERWQHPGVTCSRRRGMEDRRSIRHALHTVHLGVGCAC